MDTGLIKPPGVALTRGAAVGSLLALIVLGLAWELVLAPLGHRTLAIKVLPLAIPLNGLLRNRMYTYRWTSLLVWLYFAEGVVRFSTETGRSAQLAAMEIALAVVLFLACSLHVRLRLRGIRTMADARAKAQGIDDAFERSHRRERQRERHRDRDRSQDRSR